LLADEIYRKTRQMVRMSDSRDPFRIAKDNGVFIRFCDEFNVLKGMYKIVKRNRFIFINSNLPEYLQKIVCAHELGHDLLHKHLAKSAALQEFMLYDMTSRPEYEANMVAADILLDDDEVHELACDGYDMEQIARELYTDINLVGIKIGNMNYRGYNFNLGIRPRGDFLGR
jgi:Zn-dependent peptidase ImmA (M78 family)